MAELAAFRAVLQRIPRGKVITYGAVAKAAGYPGAARVTVRALQGRRELPWHRVVAAGGRIALADAEGAEQRLRLRLEGVTFRGDRVRMEIHAWEPGPLRRGGRARGAPDVPSPARRGAAGFRGSRRATSAGC